MFQQVSIIERIRIFFSRREALPVLILINIIVWLATLLLRSFAFLFTNPESAVSGTYSSGVSEWLMMAFAVPANTGDLLTRPWTMVTYMFLHLDFLHILFNLLWLYWFGLIFVKYLSQRQLLGTYLFGGIAGALLYVLAFNIFPVFSIARESALALGASASVLAIVVAIAFYVPEYTIHLLFLGPVKIKYIAVFSVLMDLLMLNSGNAGGHIAHLGGALWGFAWVKLLPAFDPTRIFMRSGFSPSDLFKRRRKPKLKVYKGTKPLTDEEYNKRKVLKQKKIDSILDKISRSGYDSLTKEEKELLFSNSKK
ncbi:rhomboid family intramembrane serine protease [Lentimicrobium sp.]|jgi:membrane associated rhomboid family serine protease|uniref:rhomboid family protein n=1 Tax=Lentimicrobium sp. TaxID=2034841 RepID=UPI0025D678D7|nr:rhomboid family intramembrane serine protease [Lentimicrobium sp.]MCO5255429.1 rhomboid family intramembrane serine protease [Lentimicrobium sp.]MCO5261736.1 rhomboid family intramembrane serine protease [Lentimicrobium sp.]HOP14447.1 rhomboid family intramembrane serine protease [Lentimicrobium sp.]HPF63230.1 rhomboid family intramembrane serine protease [Lentimicrobium sp.]HPJ61052.1 rhomboid family intramembrane serine protease [Lentimicrobium sp.]